MCKENSKGIKHVFLCALQTPGSDRNKYMPTWMYPRSKQWHMIDSTIVLELREELLAGRIVDCYFLNLNYTLARCPRRGFSKQVENYDQGTIGDLMVSRS